MGGGTDLLRSLGRLRRSAVLVAEILLLLVLVGIVLPRLVAFVAEHLFPLRSVLAKLTRPSGDISPEGQVSVFWRFVAWLREFYMGGD